MGLRTLLLVQNDQKACELDPESQLWADLFSSGKKDL